MPQKWGEKITPVSFPGNERTFPVCNSWIQPDSVVEKTNLCFNSLIHTFIVSANSIDYFCQWLEKLCFQILLHISVGKLNYAKVPQYDIEFVRQIEIPVQNYRIEPKDNKEENEIPLSWLLLTEAGRYNSLGHWGMLAVFL